MLLGALEGDVEGESEGDNEGALLGGVKRSTKLFATSVSPAFNVTLIILSTVVSLSNISPSGASS